VIAPPTTALPDAHTTSTTPPVLPFATAPPHCTCPSSCGHPATAHDRATYCRAASHTNDVDNTALDGTSNSPPPAYAEPLHSLDDTNIPQRRPLALRYRPAVVLLQMGHNFSFTYHPSTSSSFIFILQLCINPIAFVFYHFVTLYFIWLCNFIVLKHS
jgi:hypothetical protein